MDGGGCDRGGRSSLGGREWKFSGRRRKEKSRSDGDRGDRLRGLEASGWSGERVVDLAVAGVGGIGMAAASLVDGVERGSGARELGYQL